MGQLQQVLWSKGLLLTPQHLQLQDRYLEDLLQFRIGSLIPAPVGFSRLRLDVEALAGGRLVLLEAAGVLPDGLAFDMPGSDAAPPDRAIEGMWDPRYDFMIVHLSVPAYRPGVVNVDVHSESEGSRFRAETVSWPDDTAIGNERQVEVATKNFRLIPGAEASERHSSLPVARVTRSPNGEYVLDGEFVPPMLDIRASTYVLSMVKGIVEVLVDRSASLSGLRRERSKGLAEFGVSDIPNFWLLYTLNTHLPLFRHFLENQSGRPIDLYRAMVELAGALSAFSTEIQLDDISPYHHTDLGGTFSNLHRVLMKLLGTVVPTFHHAMTLEPVGSLIWATAIEHDEHLHGPGLYLAVRAEMAPDELIRKVPELLKVGAADRMDQLTSKAVPGVGLHHTTEPPSAIVMKLDYQYFSVERRGEEWQAVEQARNLSVYAPGTFKDPSFELVAVLPKGKPRDG